MFKKKMDLEELLKEPSIGMKHSNECFEPVIFSLRSAIEREKFNQLLRINNDIEIVDSIRMQIGELIKLQNPSRSFRTGDELANEVDKFLWDKNPVEYGNWVYYPWKRIVVHILEEDQFVELRTIRNRYKITLQEQEALRKKVIGIIGLSVGQAAALVIAQERLCGEIRIADFDHLELSNLKRIRSSITNLGLKKTTVVAREIYELDPYLKVTVYDCGVDKENIGHFLDLERPIDLLIEECDSVDIKILAREEAKTRRIPVVMDTSDRGMLDVERFDQDPHYPILHGLLDERVGYEFLNNLKTAEDKLPYILPILDVNSISLDFKASGLEVGKSITTWPQLASDVVLGGALCGNVARRILLGESIKSERNYVDLNNLIPSSEEPKSRNIDMDEGFLDRNDVHEYIIDLDLAGDEPIDRQTLLEMLNDAIKASSPGNSQRWLWAVHQNVLHLFLDKEKNIGFADNFNFGSLIGLGCAIENLKISAGKRSLSLLVDFHEENNAVGHVASIRFRRSDNIEKVALELYSQIDLRCCNRNDSPYSKLNDEEIKELLLPCPDGVKFQLVLDKDDLNKLGELVCKGDRLRLTNVYGHQDFFNNEIRWSREESIQTGDGLDVTLFNLSELDKLGLELSKDIEVIHKLNQIGGGKGFERISERAFIGASAVGIVWLDSYKMRRLLEAGMYIEHLWLVATKLGLGFQPYTVLQMLFTRLYKDELNYLKDYQRAEITSIKESFNEIVKPSEGFDSVFLFRLNRAHAPTDKSCRKPLSEKFIES